MLRLSQGGSNLVSMTLLHRPVAQLGSPAHVECWKGGCNCLEGSGRAHLLKPSTDVAGTSKVRTPPQTPPGSPFQIRGASVHTNLPSPQQNDLNAIDCDFLDDDTWPGISENSEGRFVLNNELPSGGLEDMLRHAVRPSKQMEATAEAQANGNGVAGSTTNGFYERALIPFMRRPHSPTLGLLAPQTQTGTGDHGDLQSCFSAWNTRSGFPLSSARPSAVPSNGAAHGSSIPLKLSLRSPDPLRQARFEAESPDPSASESDTPKMGASFKAPSETGRVNPGLNLVGRLRPGFDGLPARPRKLRMMREAFGAHSPPRPRALEGLEDDGDRGLDNSSGGEDGSGLEGEASDEENGGGADVSEAEDDVAADVDEEDSEYDPEEGSELESEYDPDEDEEARPTKKPRSGARGARGPSLARASSSQSLAGSEGSGGVFPPRKKGRFTEEMDRVFLQRLGELFRQKVMLKDSFRYFPGRTPRQLRRHWMRVKHKYGIGSIKNVENVLARLGPLKKEKDPLSLKQLSSYFKLPMEEACARFNERRGQQLTFQKFRQLFQKHGINRWPYRQVMAGKPVSEVLTEAKAAVQELKAREAAAEQVPEFLPEGGAELALSAPPADRSVTTARKTTRRPGVNGNAQPGGKPRLMVPPNKGAAVAGKGHAKGGVKSGKHAAGRRFPLAHKPAAADMPALEEQPARNAVAGRGRGHQELLEDSASKPKKRSRSRK